MNDSDYRSIIAKHGLTPPPDGEIVYATYTLRGEGWWVRIKGKGWFWLCVRFGVKDREWKPSYYGPTA